MQHAVQFDPEMLERYGLNGPRYTSYPTAMSFHDGFGAEDYRRQAALSNEDFIPRPLSLYLHLPFCRSLCYYCACNKKITRHARHGEDYLHWLEQEVVLQGALFDRDREVRQLHLGGGTPTFFDDAQLDRIMGWLGRAFHLSPSPEREFSLEIDPRTVDPARLASLAALGFNRLSLGVQDLDPVVQGAINRIQEGPATLALISAARRAGFESVSLDLIYGLPHQTLERFTATLEAVVRVRPDRLSVYNYAHLPDRFRAQRLIRGEDLPSPGERLSLLQRTIELMLGAGYEYIGMDHFALPGDDLVRARDRGRLQRNFQGYSTFAECDLVGMGVSAIGKVADCYAQNHHDIPAWRRSLQAGELPLARGVVLGEEDRLRRRIIETLMCHGQLDFDALGREYGIDFPTHFAPEIQVLDGLARDGLLIRTDTGIEVTPRGRLLLRVVAMVFDESLSAQRANGSYSRVI